MIGAAKTLAINFYGLRELTQSLAPRLREGGAVVNVASIAGYGWRANLERAKAFVSAPGFPDLAKLLAAHKVPDAEAYPLSRSSCSCGPCGRRMRHCSRSADCA